MTSAAADEAKVLVLLLDYPLAIAQETSQHYEGVMREFALLVATGRAGEGSIPQRVLTLVSALGERRARNNEIESRRSAALARGETRADFELSVPPSVLDISRQLDACLDEADMLSRGGQVLTLFPTDQVVAFRHWYLAELVRQVGGGEPVPWSWEPS